MRKPTDDLPVCSCAALEGLSPACCVIATDAHLEEACRSPRRRGTARGGWARRIPADTRGCTCRGERTRGGRCASGRRVSGRARRGCDLRRLGRFFSSRARDMARACFSERRSLRENAPLVPADLENVRPKLALGYLREVLDLPREFPVQVRRLKACGVTERERG